MKTKRIIILLIIFSHLFIYGCASTTPRCGYLTDERSREQFDKLSDEETLKLFYRVYDLKVNNVYDEEAKNIAVDSFLKLLQSRKSEEIEGSGVFELKRKNVDLSKWTDGDLIEMHRYLKRGKSGESDDDSDEEPESMDFSGNRYWVADKDEKPDEKITDREAEINKNTLELVHLVAVAEVGIELTRRDNTEGFWAGTGYLLSGIIGITAQLAMTAAKFFIFFI